MRRPNKGLEPTLRTARLSPDVQRKDRRPAMNEAYVAENAAERERLRAIVANLDDDGLALPLPNGWTVATALVHLAFWDSYYLACVGEWERTGFAPSRANVDAINEAVHMVSLALPPRAAVQMVQAAADAIDRKLEGLAPQLASAIEGRGHTRILCRAMHRREHLDHVELELNERTV